MLSNLRLQAARRPSASLASIRRWYATETRVPGKIEESEEKQREQYEEFLAQKEKIPPTRPQLKVEVNPNHGLYHFFRQVPVEGGTSFVYDTVESVEKPGTKLGRAWNATELRRKSFKDLHTLWYIVLRERNLLATQQVEAKRLGIMEAHLDTGEKDKRCRKTMARIKQILNERRLAYEQAYALDYERFKAAEARRAQKAQSQSVSEENSGSSGIPAVPGTAVPSSEAPTRGRRLRRVKQTTVEPAVVEVQHV